MGLKSSPLVLTIVMGMAVRPKPCLSRDEYKANQTIWLLGTPNYMPSRGTRVTNVRNADMAMN
jgi:hypothetical protein